MTEGASVKRQNLEPSLKRAYARISVFPLNPLCFPQNGHTTYKINGEVKRIANFNDLAPES